MKFQSLIASCAIFVGGCASHQITEPADAPLQADKLNLTPAHGVVLQTTANPAIKQGYALGPDGRQIHYWEAGQGPTLLLLHQMVRLLMLQLEPLPMVLQIVRIL